MHILPDTRCTRVYYCIPVRYCCTRYLSNRRTRYSVRVLCTDVLYNRSVLCTGKARGTASRDDRFGVLYYSYDCCCVMLLYTGKSAGQQIVEQRTHVLPGLRAGCCFVCTDCPTRRATPLCLYSAHCRSRCMIPAGRLSGRHHVRCTIQLGRGGCPAFRSGPWTKDKAYAGGHNINFNCNCCWHDPPCTVLETASPSMWRPPCDRLSAP